MVPGVGPGIGAFTERDRECLAFALENGVDAGSRSFVSSRVNVPALFPELITELFFPASPASLQPAE